MNISKENQKLNIPNRYLGTHKKKGMGIYNYTELVYGLKITDENRDLIEQSSVLEFNKDSNIAIFIKVGCSDLYEPINSFKSIIKCFKLNNEHLQKIIGLNERFAHLKWFRKNSGFDTYGSGPSGINSYEDSYKELEIETELSDKKLSEYRKYIHYLNLNGEFFSKFAKFKILTLENGGERLNTSESYKKYIKILKDSIDEIDKLFNEIENLEETGVRDSFTF
jgi:hypothetical protein